MAAPRCTMTGIFISYRREHSAAIVGRLHDRLADHFGPRQVVRDVGTVDGQEFDERIEAVVGSSAAFLAIVTDRWLLDRNPVGKRPIGIPRDWVQREVEAALRRPDVLVIPVLIEGAAMPSEQELPYSIRSLATCNALRLSDHGWEGEVGKLIQTLEEVIEPQGAASATARVSADAQPGPGAAASAPPPDDPPTRRRFRRR